MRDKKDRHLPFWYLVMLFQVIGLIVFFPFYIIYLLAKNQK